MWGYYDKVYTGGSDNAAGGLYQDYCALICLFQHVDDPKFQCLALEEENDFCVLFKNREISVQVKKYTINVVHAKTLLNSAIFDESKENVFISDAIDDHLRVLQIRKKSLLNAKNSPRNEKIKEKRKHDFKLELKKYKIENLYNKFLHSEFKPIGEGIAKTYLHAVCGDWLFTRRINVHKENFINHLQVIFQELRAERGFFTKQNFDEILGKYIIRDAVVKNANRTTESRRKKISELYGVTPADIPLWLADKFLEADNLLKKESYEEVLGIFEAVAKLWDNEQVLLKCAILSKVTNSYAKIMKYCDDVLNKNGKNIDAYIIKGTALGESKEFDKAIICFKSALSLKPTPDVFFNLGYTYQLKGEVDNAIQRYLDCLGIDETNVDVHLNISKCYYDMGAPLEALNHIDLVLDVKPEMYQALVRKGEILRFVGLYEEAIKYFERCLKYDSLNYEALYGISISLIESGFINEGCIYLSQWIRTYKEKLFDRKVGKISITDLGWKRIVPIKITYDNDRAIFSILNLDLSIELNLEKELIFVGCVQLSDETGSMLYPAVGKLFKTSNTFYKVVNEIKSRVDIFQYFDTSTYVCIQDEIKVLLQEREDNSYIEIRFKDYVISGLTDAGSKEGFHGFVDYFQEYGQFRIELVSLEDKKQFIIDGIKNIEIRHDFCCVNLK